MRPSGIPIRH